MKVYLIDVDNGEQWEDHRHWVRKVFSSYQAAYDWLWSKDYRPFNPKYDDELVLEWLWKESDEYMANSSFATIIEMDVED